VDRTGSGLYPVVGFTISMVELLYSGTQKSLEISCLQVVATVPTAFGSIGRCNAVFMSQFDFCLLIL